MGRRIEGWRLGVLALVMALAGCGGGGSGGDPPARETSATIGTAGGTLTGPDGVELVVPPGALTQDTTLRIARIDSGAPGLPADYTASTPTYEFTPHGQLFRLPVTIRMPYGAPAGAAHADVFMAAPGGDWQPVVASVDGGVAEWQRLSLSYGAGLACSLSAGADPRSCLWPQIGATATASPSTAMTTIPSSQGTAHDVTAAATVSFAVAYSSANNCASPRLRVLRNNYSGPVSVLFDGPVLTSPSQSNPQTVSGSTVFDVAVTDADNGSAAFAFFFSCTRPNGTTATALSGAYQLLRIAIPDPGTPTIPAVTTQPANQSVVEPALASFSAAANGTPTPTIQWQASTDGGSTWADIAGATSATYTTPATSTVDDGKRFRAVFTNSAGAATSNAAVLAVAPSQITAPPPFLGLWPAATSLVQVGNDTGGLVRETKVACGRGGHCVAAWARISTNDPSNAGVYAARYVTGTGWSAAVQLSADEGREPAVGIDDNGNALVAWSARDGADVFQVFARRFVVGSGWRPVAQTSPAGSEPAVPPLAVAINGSGQTIALYQRRLLADNNVASLWASRPSGGGWNAVRVASGVAVDTETGLHLTLDPLSRATVAWSDGSSHVVTAASGAANGSWSAAVALSGARQSRDLRLAIDIDGAAYAAWTDFGSGSTLSLRRRPIGAAWAAAQTVAVPEGIDELDLAAGPAGKATATYVRGSGTIVTRDFDVPTGWDASDLVIAAETVDDYHYLPRIVMDTGGNTTVACVRSNGQVLARSYAIGLGWSPALGMLPTSLATYDQTLRELVLTGTGTGRAAVLIVRTDTSFLDELLGAVQRAP